MAKNETAPVAEDKTQKARSLMQKTVNDLTQRIVDGGARSMAARSVRAAAAGVDADKLKGAYGVLHKCLEEAEAALDRYLENPQEPQDDDAPSRYDF